MQFIVRHFEFDLDIADLITSLAFDGQWSVDEYLTRPGIALARTIVDMSVQYVDMSDEDFLHILRPVAYQHLVNEWT